MARLAAIALLLAILGATLNAADVSCFLELPPDVLPSDVGGSAFAAGAAPGGLGIAIGWSGVRTGSAPTIGLAVSPSAVGVRVTLAAP